MLERSKMIAQPKEDNRSLYAFQKQGGLPSEAIYSQFRNYPLCGAMLCYRVFTELMRNLINGKDG